MNKKKRYSPEPTTQYRPTKPLNLQPDRKTRQLEGFDDTSHDWLRIKTKEQSKSKWSKRKNIVKK